MTNTISAMPESNPWSLHPQLAADTAAVGDLPLCRLLVMNDANYPWLILVPRRAGTIEIADLDEMSQAQLMREITGASTALKDLTACDKINIAALGNVVPQLHVHVIARRRNDLAWPAPVWNAAPARRYGRDELGGFIARLRTKLSPDMPLEI